jgi:hypothetical protein
MREWFVRQYDDIKGHYKWALLVVSWAPIFAVIKRVLRLIPNIPEWAVWTVLFFLSAVAFVWLAKSQKLSSQGAALSQTERTAPLVSSSTKFDAERYFRTAYHSPLTEEVEVNIKKAAADNQPNDREGFYVKFIGVGFVAYVYDTIWFAIYGSQLLALLELNRRSGLLPLAGIKHFYDKAVASNPIQYAHYTFDQWLGFMKTQLLLIVHPSNMVELTIRGKDFLKYLLHNGREASQRAL